MKVGIQAVDNYLICKSIFEKILEIRQDHREAVYLNIQFLQDVMNFEQESRNSIALLKNIDQKQQILKRNSNYVDLNNRGIIIMSYNSTQKNKLIYCNEFICKVLNYKKSQLEGQYIDIIIPSIFRETHNKLIKRLLDKTLNKTYFSHLKRIWALKSDQVIIPFSSLVQIQTSSETGIAFVSIFDKPKEIQTKKLNLNPDQCFIMLADEYDCIRYVSDNFNTNFPRITDEILSQQRFKIDFFFQNLDSFNDEDLQEGVCVKLHQRACNHKEFQNFLQMYQNFEFNLIITKHQCEKGNQIVKEIIFCKNLQNENYSLPLFDSQHLQSRNLIQNVYESESMNEDKFDMGSISSNSSVSTSNSKQLMHQKQQTNLQEAPQSIKNLKKAIIFYFLSLILTSFLIFFISQYSYNDFQVQVLCLELNANMFIFSPNVRLAFIMMINLVNDNTNLIRNEEDEFNQIKSEYDYFYEQLRLSYNEMINFKIPENKQIKDVLDTKNVSIYTLSSTNQIEIHFQTYHVGYLEYLNKLQKFSNFSYQQFDKYFKNYDISKPELFKNEYEQNAYEVFINGHKDLSDLSFKVGQLFVENAQQQTDNYINMFLGISIACIFITMIVTSLLAPVTLSLDNEQEANISNLFLISTKAKENVRFRINQFLKHVDYQQNQHQNELIKQVNSPDLQNDNESLVSNSKIMSVEPLELIITENLFELQKNSSVIYKTKNYNSTSLSQITTICGFQTSSLVQQNENKIKEIYKILELKKIQKKQKHAKQEKKEQSNAFKIKLNNIQEKDPHEIECVDLNLITFEQKHGFQNNQSQNSNKNQIEESYLEKLEMSQKQKIDQKQENENQTQTEEQIRQVKSFFQKQKGQKCFFIMLFAFFIIAFYISQIFTSRLIYSQARKSFGYQYDYNSIPNCLSSPLNNIILQGMINQTLYVNFSTQTAFQNLKGYCSDVLTTYINRMTKPPPQLVTVGKEILNFNTPNFCHIINLSESDIQNCLQQQNGILSNGYYQTIQQIYYQIYNEHLEFQSKEPSQRNQTFLSDITYNQNNFDSAITILKYLMDGWVTINEIHDEVLGSYLYNQIQGCTVSFTIFVLFLIGSMIFALKYIIKNLQNVAIRSKIMLKVIPNEELKIIEELQRRNQKQ